MRHLVIAVVLMSMFSWACTGSDSKKDVTGENDTSDVTPDAGKTDGKTEDLLPDQLPGDLGDDGEPGDLIPDEADSSDVQLPPKKRFYTFRGIGGMSMGAGALTLHVNHLGVFDMVGANGGYINYNYLADFFRRAFFAGFCPMEQILAHLDEVNDPASPNLQCGPVVPRDPWEFSVDFNHWHPDDSGGTWDRDFYWYAIQGICTAFGNIVNYNPDHPYLPAGVPVDWADAGDTTERCQNPYVVGKPYNYSAEYNPEGTYNLVTFCDEEEPIPGGKDNPDYWNLMGVYDPTYFHREPIHIMLAVDYNGNGHRDFHEPVIVNLMERFVDSGPDGCTDDREDGNGGCSASNAKNDPNGDNYNLETNPFGAEGNNLWDDGEGYNDFGLDGVDNTDDYGEGDGKFSINPNAQRALDRSAINWIDNAPQEEIDAVDITFDGGIRDALHALVGMYGVVQHLKVREPNTKVYDTFSLLPTALYPKGKDVTLDLYLDKLNLTPEKVGKNFIVRYGNPDATPAEIAKGDGKHVGSGNEIFNRALVMLLTPLFRWPEIDKTVCEGADDGDVLYRTFYSPALQNRYGYAITIPPCYDADPNSTYPYYIYLLGHGMYANDSSAVGLVFNLLMKQGAIGKFMLVIPEGQCCRISKSTGDRYCGCYEKPDVGGKWFCSEPTCTGTHEECAEIEIDKGDLEQECNGGHFFANQQSNRWGDTSAAEYMKYEDMVFDLVDHLDTTYKARPGKEYEIE